MSKNEYLKATLEWEGKKAQFEGSPEEVWKSINKFLIETNPQIVSLLDFLIKVNVVELLTKLKGIAYVDKDVGPVISVDADIGKLNDTERIVFFLLIKKTAYMTKHSDKETMDVDEVKKESKAKNAGVLLSQLTAEKIVQNMAEAGKKGAYRITDYGTQWFISKVLKKLQSEIE